MKNISSIKDDDITSITKKLQDSDISISSNKVLNIANRIDNLGLSSEEEKLLVLEYASRIRAAVTKYIDSLEPSYLKYDYYDSVCNTIYYALIKVVSSIDPDDPLRISPLDDDKLEIIVNDIVKDFRNELTKNNRKSMTLKLN